MAIPKEPRALMINLMYLVLTAMLALNVSAEIINAFFQLDKGIKKTNKIVSHASEKVIEGMDETAKTKVQYAPLVVAAKAAQVITKEFTVKLDEIRDRMVEESGGTYTEEEYPDKPSKWGKPKGYKDKDTPQRIFVSGDYGNEKKDPQGPAVMALITDTRAKYAQLVEGLWAGTGIKGTIFADVKKKTAELEKLQADFTIAIDDAYKAAEKYNEADPAGSWAEFTFGHMPVAAIYPMLRKFQNDAKTTEAAVINFLANQMGKLEITYDKFDVFAQAPKSYILLGETFESEIALGAYSSQSKFSVSVGGSSLKIVDGKAKYTSRPGSIGEKSYNAKISVLNPLTGETSSFTKEFKYEVGAPSVNVSAEKMNVFYCGVKNPIKVAAAGVSTASLKVESNIGSLVKKNNTDYVLQPKSPMKDGTGFITVKDTKKGKSYKFPFRVKRIPDPMVKLGKEVGPQIQSGKFKALPLIPWLDGFDFEAKCRVEKYTMYYTPKREEPLKAEGSGSKWAGKAKSYVSKAKPGDQYTITNIKVRCPGDKVARLVNTLTFMIR